MSVTFVKPSKAFSVRTGARRESSGRGRVCRPGTSAQPAAGARAALRRHPGESSRCPSSETRLRLPCTRQFPQATSSGGHRPSPQLRAHICGEPFGSVAFRCPLFKPESGCLPIFLCLINPPKSSPKNY